MIRRFILLSAALAASVLLASCGQTDKSVSPDPVNPFAAARVGADSTLEIMTWNIENFAKRGDVTVGRVEEVIKGLEVDVVALQEIQSQTYFNRLRQDLPGWAGDRATSAYADINLAYLYRVGAEITVDAVYEIFVDSQYSRPFPRAPFVLEGRHGTVPFVVINNHYKCCGDGTIGTSDSDEEVRRRNANLLLEEFVTANYPGENVIIVGDLNDKLTDVAPNNVFQNFLDDADHWRFVDMTIAETLGALWSYPNSNSHLDHVLVTDALFAALSAPEALIEVVPLHTLIPGGWSTYDRDVSDHLPVVLRLELAVPSP